MSRLTKEMREQIFSDILTSENDVTIITPLLQQLRDDYLVVDEDFETLSVSNSDFEGQIKDMKQKYYDTFINGRVDQDITNENNSNENEELTVASFDELIIA